MIQKFFRLFKSPLVLLLAMALLLGGCGGDVTAEETRIVMGTVAHLTVRADEITSQAALRDGLAVLTATEEDADGAVLARVEEAAGTGAWTEVSPALYETLSLAQEMARQSDGAFDVTSGTLTELWDAARAAQHPPRRRRLRRRNRASIGVHLSCESVPLMMESTRRCGFCVRG